MAKKRKIWRIREDYRSLLIKTKKLFPTVLAHIRTKRIALAGVYNKRNPFMAKIWANRYPYSLHVPQYDYLIAFWSTRFDGKPFSYRVFVMLHELAHIPPEGQVKGAVTYRKCVKHDIEDFQFLREAYGIKLENVKDVLKGEETLLIKGRKKKPDDQHRAERIG